MSHKKLSFKEILDLSPEDYERFQARLEAEKSREQKAAEYKEYKRFAGYAEDEGVV